MLPNRTGGASLALESGSVVSGEEDNCATYAERERERKIQGIQHMHSPRLQFVVFTKFCLAPGLSTEDVP